MFKYQEKTHGGTEGHRYHIGHELELNPEPSCHDVTILIPAQSNI